MGDELVKVGIVAEDKTGPGVASAKRNLEGLGKGAQSATQSFNGLKAAAIGVGGALAVIGGSAVIGGLTNMAAGALRSYAEFERLGQSINALTAKQALLNGSASTMTQAMAQTSKQSKELLDWIQKLAIESPFKQQDVAQAFRLSMALGFSTKEAQRLTSAMLNFTTATGQGGETIERINRALGQMRTKGKVSLEEINQLTEAGVDAMRILQDATGKTGEALYKDISKGAVSADFAINAIIADTEKLYAGAGASSATSMAGLLSTLEEIQDITSRNFMSGVFEQLQGPLSTFVAILSAPEFQAGITAWGDKLGGFTGEQIEGAAAAMERINTAIQPLLNAGAPLWLTTLQAVMAAGDYTLGINIKPTVTSITTPDGGLTVDVTAHAIDVTTAEGQTVKVTADWREGTIGSAIAAFQAKTQEEQNKILVNAGWKGDAFANLQRLIDATQLWASVSPVLKMGQFAVDSGKVLWDAVQAVFTGKPVDVEAKAEENSLYYMAGYIKGFFLNDDKQVGVITKADETALQSMWTTVQQMFANNPITLAMQGTPVSVGVARGIVANNTDMLMSSPETKQGVGFLRGRAIGDGFFRGGLALVGEQGPELTVLPRGTQIYNNRDTKTIFGGGVPHFAGGTTQLPPGAGPFIALLRGMGLWKSVGGGATMGPKTQADSGGWRDFTNQGAQAMQTAADRTGAAFEETAAKVNKTFESALQSVPGLFGTSQVTADDMRKSQLGLYQPKADEYLRQLSDEVMNGKDWGAGVDIKDAAKRAGIDPNLPNDIILELVKEAWNNSSLFAEGKNLDLINTDAVKAAIEQQQKELSGQASLKAMFGITDENLQQQSEALGQGLAAVFGGASETDTVKGAGTALFAKVMGGFGDPATAAAGVAGMAGSIVDATGTPENQAALYDAGEAGYTAYYRGWNAAANAAPIVPPGGGTTPPPGTTTPPAKAVGVGFWQGGWMQVHRNENIYAPRGTEVRNAREGARGGVTVINNVTIANQIDKESFLADLARRVRRAS